MVALLWIRFLQDKRIMQTFAVLSGLDLNMMGAEVTHPSRAAAHSPTLELCASLKPPSLHHRFSLAVSLSRKKCFPHKCLDFGSIQVHI